VHNDVLVRHFLAQFVENDLFPETDRHQVLAVAAAGLVTIPLFVTVFMSVKYLMQPLQAPGWTETTVMGDEVTFCAASLLVAAAVTLLEWDALALGARDAAILGVLPVPHRAVVRAKLTALVIFTAGFSMALNAVPALLHPLFMSAQLLMSPVMLLPLTFVQALTTMMAATLGVSAVLAVRESIYFVLGPSRFLRISGALRSTLLFAVLMLLALVPIRMSDAATWMFDDSSPSALLRPVSWFAATHAALAGRLLDGLPRPDLPPMRAHDEQVLTDRYRAKLPGFTRMAAQGVAALVITGAMSIGLHLWNARRMHVLIAVPRRAHALRGIPHWRLTRVAGRPGRRAGLQFAGRALLRSPTHRLYMVFAAVAGIALFTALSGNGIGTAALAAQTLLVGCAAAGFRAAVRTAADYRAGWIFDVADTGSLGVYRDGVRWGGIALVVAVIAALLPFEAANWGWSIARAHAVNGAAIGWLLVEISMADVERPLVISIPPSDGMNTVGVVLGGAAVIVIFIVAHVEELVLGTHTGRVLFPLTFAAIACGIRAFGIRH
jgi:hypothetical protein